MCGQFYEHTKQARSCMEELAGQTGQENVRVTVIKNEFGTKERDHRARTHQWFVSNTRLLSRDE